MRLDLWNSPLFKIIVVALLFQQADTNFSWHFSLSMRDWTC